MGIGEMFFRNQRVFRAVRGVTKKKKITKIAPRHKPANRNIRHKRRDLVTEDGEGWRGTARDGVSGGGGAAAAQKSGLERQ